MVFTGADLSNVLARSGDEIELRNEYGRHCRVLSHGEALALDSDLFVGVGNVRRIRFLRPRIFRTILNAGSHTTQRIKDRSGKIIAPPLIREHRPVQGVTK
jgi:hypothetical protein